MAGSGVAWCAGAVWTARRHAWPGWGQRARTAVPFRRRSSLMAGGRRPHACVFRSRFRRALGRSWGRFPLPPYIRDFGGDRGRYQTVYSRAEGSVAAPTAGLHFTPALLQDFARSGHRLGDDHPARGVGHLRPGHGRKGGGASDSPGVGASGGVSQHAPSTQPPDSREAGLSAVGTTTLRARWNSRPPARRRIDPCRAAAPPPTGRALSRPEVDLFIYPGYSLSGCGRAVDELSSAPFLAVDAGQRLCRAGPSPGSRTRAASCSCKHIRWRKRRDIASSALGMRC